MSESHEPIHIQSARIPSELHAQLARSARRHERSLSGEVRLALREHVLQRPAGPLEPVEPVERRAENRPEAFARPLVGDQAP